MIPKKFQLAVKQGAALTAAIQAIDLTPLRTALRHHRLTTEQIEYIEQKYRRFLFLCGTHARAVIPTQDVELLWHPHILDTMKYREDCQEVFGFFLDHYPYFGLNGDQIELQTAFEWTCAIYENTFGDPYETSDAMRVEPELEEKLHPHRGAANCG
jgi:hypothetical protein